MSADLWEDGTPKSRGNTFEGAKFIQPVRPDSNLTDPFNGQATKFISEPRVVVIGDAENTAMAFNTAGKLMRVKMIVPGPSIATIADKKTNPQVKAAI